MSLQLGNPFNVVMPPEDTFLLGLKNGETRNILHWIPENEEIKGTILFLHGYGGTARRWQHVAKYHTDAGYQVYSMDQAFHGDNESNTAPNGWKAIHKLESFNIFVQDAIEFVQFVEKKHPDIPYFVHGHSMGGLVWILTLLEIQHSWKGRGAIFCAPALRMLGQGISPNNLLPYQSWFVQLTNFLDFVSFGYFPNDAAAVTVTTDNPVVQEDIRKNPKMFGTMLCVRFWIKFRNASTEAFNRLEDLNVPFLVIHGTKDKVTDLSGSQQLNKVSKSNDKSLMVIEKAYHELMNPCTDAEHERVKSAINKWVQDRT